MDNRKEYRRMCKRLTDTLMKDDMTAIMVQLKIDRATRSTVTDGRRFIDVLEMREIIGVGNFYRLIPLLKDHELDQIASLLEEYMDDYKKATESLETGSNNQGKIAGATENVNKEHSISTEANEVSSNKTLDMCEEHKATRGVICLRCFTKLCYECFYKKHRDHHVVSMNDLASKTEDEEKAVQSLFETLEEDKKNLESEIMVLEENIRSPIEFELQSFSEKSAEDIHALQHRCADSIKNVTQFSKTYLRHITDVLSEVENDISLSEKEIGVKLFPDAFTKLYELNKRVRKMTDNENNVTKISQQLRDGSLEISIRPTSISANIVRVAHGCILGVIMANAEQMVVIRSQGNSRKVLSATCISCLEPKILFWERTFECEYGPYPVVLGNTLHVASSKIKIVVGCGNKIIMIHVDETEDLLFFVKMTITNVDIPKDSYITGISPITGKMLDRGVIVSDKTSQTLQILDNDFTLSKKLKYPGDFQMITCLFRENVYKCAVATFKSQTVDVLKASPNEEIPSEFAKLAVKDSGLCPQSLLFDGTFFTVLWVSGENTYSEGQKWKVVAYDDDGKECNVCKEGSCHPNITAVSISHVKNDTLLCFSNGTFDLFQTANI